MRCDCPGACDCADQEDPYVIEAWRAWDEATGLIFRLQWEVRYWKGHAVQMAHGLLRREEELRELGQPTSWRDAA